MRWLRRASASAVLLVVSSAAHAQEPVEPEATPPHEPSQPTEPAPEPDGAAEAIEQARMLYDEGRELFHRGDYGPACAKLADSERLNPQLNTQYGLAECYEKTGRLASAWRMLLKVASTAHAVGLAAQEEHARQRAEEVKPRVAHVQIIVPPAQASTRGFHLVLDGKPLSPDDWAQPTPMDPGRYELQVRAPDHVSATHTIVVPSEDGAQITLQVPALVRVPKPAPPKAPPPIVITDEGLGGVFIGGVIVAAVGAAGMVIGGVVGLSAKSRFDDSEPHCDERRCDHEGLQIRQEAYDQGNVATGIFVAGSIVAAAGAVMMVVGPLTTGGDEPATLDVGIHGVRLVW